MKKYILCCIAALCSTFEMAADNISVQYEQVVRGETVTLSVNLNNSSSNRRLTSATGALKVAEEKSEL